MDFQEIKELMELFSQSDLDRLKIKREGFEFKLVRRGESQINGEPVSAATLDAPPKSSVASNMPEVVEDDQLHYVTSPIVGTFYAASNPKADPFVSVGSRVSVGQTLCIVEAMKLMNEIQSDASGEVVACFVENAQPIEYGQKLFSIRTVG